MKTLLNLCLLFLGVTISYSQRNCAFDSTGLIPLPDLGASQWRGFTGGLYYNGTNNRPSDHRNKALQQASAIRALDINGKPSNDGSIVWIGVGASNPRTEFLRFSAMIDTLSRKNSSVRLINTCIGGQGIQKMNSATDNYWKQAEKQLSDSGLSAKQVQVAWIETDNTQSADTSFPRAAETFRDELRTLLATMKSLYPNIKLCYVTARAYSGFVDLDSGASVGRGLLHPRDYYNGWSIKMLIEKQMSGDPQYAFEQPGDPLLFVTWGSYHWTDGSRKRADGFSIQCSTDVGADGLHLSEAGEIKMGALMFDYFTKDETVSPWLYSTTSAVDIDLENLNELRVYPQPCSVQATFRFTHSGRPLQLYNALGQLMWQGLSAASVSINTGEWSSGLYILHDGSVSRSFCVQH